MSSTLWNGPSIIRKRRGAASTPSHRCDGLNDILQRANGLWSFTGEAVLEQQLLCPTDHSQPKIPAMRPLGACSRRWIDDAWSQAMLRTVSASIRLGSNTEGRSSASPKVNPVCWLTRWAQEVNVPAPPCWIELGLALQEALYAMAEVLTSASGGRIARQS